MFNLTNITYIPNILSWIINVANIIQALLIIFIAPLLSGFVKWLKCQLQNRRGPSIIQPYRNLIKLFRKEVIVANTSSVLFCATPYIIFSIMVLVASIVPFLISKSII